MKLFTYLLLKLQSNCLTFLLLLICSLSFTNLNAQCPVGETEVTISFTSEESTPDELATFEWNYITGGLISDEGPFAITGTQTICVPDGELLITVCGSDYYVWANTKAQIKVTEDGSVNGCEAQNGCSLEVENVNYSYYYAGFYSLNACEDMQNEPILSVTIGCDNSPVQTVGCTNADAPNYNPCAIEDDGTCKIQSPNNDCSNAIPLTFSPDIYNTESNPINNAFNSASGLIPSCFYSYYSEPATDIFYEVELPASGNVAMSIPYGTNVTFYDTCGGTELYCEPHSSGYNEIYGLPGGENVILQVWQYNKPAFFEFWIAALPATSGNSDCATATQLCGTLVSGNNENANFGADDPAISCIGPYGGYNSVWYSFTADDSGQPISVFIDEEYCVSDFYGGPYEGYGGLYSGIFSGSCGAFMEEDCTTRFYEGSNTYILNLEEPIPNETYYLYISMYSYLDYCNFRISTSTGIETCCGPDVTINAVCDADTTTVNSYYADIAINDLADNPSGYTINGGSFPDITSTGVTQIGPFFLGIDTITLTGKDDPSCLLTFNIDGTCEEKIVHDCSNPKPISISPKGECEGVESIFPDQDSGLVPSCFEEYSGYYGMDAYIRADYFFSFIVPPSGKFKISNGNFGYTIYEDCSTELFCKNQYYIDEEFSNFEPGQELILQIFQQYPETFGLCIEEILEVEPANNDECENAIPICGGVLSGDTEGASNNQSDPAPSCIYYDYSYEEKGNVWYTFESDNSGADVNFYIKENCGYENYNFYGFYDIGFVATIYSGNCAGTFNEESCVYISALYSYDDDPELITLENPQPNTTYYLVIEDLPGGGCPFEITPASGVANCCNADISVSTFCNDDNKDQYYLEVQVNDLGGNPSGYSVNDGAFPDITATGSTTVGPFDNGFATLALTGLDDATCEISTGVDEKCGLVSNNFCSKAIPVDLESPFTCIELDTDNYPFQLHSLYDLDNELQFASGDCVLPHREYVDAYYEVTVPESGGFYVYYNFGYDVISVAYDACDGEEISCNQEKGFHVIKDRTPGETVIIQFLVVAPGSSSIRFDFCFEERPADSPNDLCENAIEINCDTNFYGSIGNATLSDNDAITSCDAPGKTIWYKVKPTASLLWLRINDSNTDLSATYLSGPCGGPYVTERCVSFNDRTAFVLRDPVIGQEYFIQISGNMNKETTFQIIVDEGLRSCDELCQPIVDLTASCPNGYEDASYIDIDMTDLGENPSGYIVNNGDFPNITSTGVTTVGPFNPGIAKITLEGLDVPGCVFADSISAYCVPPPANDFCENAIELSCNGIFSANNIGSTFSDDEQDCTNFTPDNSVWYSFLPESDFRVTVIFDGVPDSQELSSGIYSGSCGGSLERITCENYFYRNNSLRVRDPDVGATYYLQIVGLHDYEGEYDLIVSEGLGECPVPDVTFTPTCPSDDEQDVFYIDVEVNDLGESPAGFVINEGVFPNIITTGVTTVGPFDNGTANITIEGIDAENYSLEETLIYYCNCSEINTTETSYQQAIFKEDSVVLFGSNSIPQIENGCITKWVTDLNDIDNTTIGEESMLTIIPDSTTVVYGITDCVNCTQTIKTYSITVLEYTNCDELTVAVAVGGVLDYDYFFYSDSLEAYLSIELVDTNACEFLYWTTDLSDPTQNIVSTEESATLEVPVGSTTTYYAVVDCGEDGECAEAVTVYTPIWWWGPGCCDPIDPYYYYPVDPDDPDGSNGAPGEPNEGEDGVVSPAMAAIQCPEINNLSICAPVSISSPMTLEDFNPGEDASFMNSMSMQLDEQIDVQEYYTTTTRVYTLGDENGNQKTCETQYHIANQFIEAPKNMQPSIMCQEELWTHFKIGKDKYKIYADDDGFMGEEMSICSTPGLACPTSELGVNTNESNTYNFWVTTFFEFPDGSICESTPELLNVEVNAKPVAELSMTQKTIGIGESLPLMDYVSINKNGYWTGTNVVYTLNQNNDNISYFSSNETGLYKLYYTVKNDFCESSYILAVNVAEENSSASRPILSEIFEHDAGDILSIYPNPASDKVFIHFTGEDDYNLKLTDITGKVIKQIETVNYQNTLTIDVADIHKGIYFIELKNAYNKTIEKLIIE